MNTEITETNAETVTVTRERLRVVFEELGVVAPCPGGGPGVRFAGGELADLVMAGLVGGGLPYEPGLWVDRDGELWVSNGRVAVLLGSEAAGWGAVLRPYPIDPDGLVGECAPFTRLRSMPVIDGETGDAAE
ncbi:hypothetical protein [Bifidobacterium samirii]|uniref:hypothetical protein n=1 Tax=Bifidobacterium samirii TaxID=2306974 RepID=UPI000F7DDDE9|nr:hypothetical protein [Bifidobacterium samirii]